MTGRKPRNIASAAALAFCTFSGLHQVHTVVSATKLHLTAGVVGSRDHSGAGSSSSVTGHSSHVVTKPQKKFRFLAAKPTTLSMKMACATTFAVAMFCPTGNCAPLETVPFVNKKPLLNQSRFISSYTGGPLPADNCPMSYPSKEGEESQILGMVQDETVTEAGAFQSAWPAKILNGKWYVIAAADAFQPTEEYKCTHYDYKFDQNSGLPRAVWNSFDVDSKQWQKIPLQGELMKSTSGTLIPGGYRETPMRMGEKQDPWFVPIVHFTDEGEQQDILVKWGCTKPPQGNVNFVEVLSRKPNVDYTEVIEAIAHLMQEGQEITPVIENMRPVTQDCPDVVPPMAGMDLCRGPDCDENRARGSSSKETDLGNEQQLPIAPTGTHLCRGPHCDENRKSVQLPIEPTGTHLCRGPHCDENGKSVQLPIEPTGTHLCRGPHCHENGVEVEDGGSMVHV